MKIKRGRVDLTSRRGRKLANSLSAKLLKQVSRAQWTSGKRNDSQGKLSELHRHKEVFPQPDTSELRTDVTSENEDRKTEEIHTHKHTRFVNRNKCSVSLKSRRHKKKLNCGKYHRKKPLNILCSSKPRCDTLLTSRTVTPLHSKL
jgi:hypothetical protein